jgi:hypothetical protein
VILDVKLVDRWHAYHCGGFYLRLCLYPIDCPDGTSADDEANDTNDDRFEHGDLLLKQAAEWAVCGTEVVKQALKELKKIPENKPT